MKILVVGGGSGGHVTPAVAVIREILKQKPRTRVEFWTDRKYYKNVVKITTEIGMSWGEEERLSGKRQYIRVCKIAAGKFHRYSGWKLKDYFEHIDLTLKDLIWGNIVGFVGFVLGFIQSLIRLAGPRYGRPDVIFLKGGFVGLPVGIVARILKIPYVVHESDAVPGLANRLLMKGAKVVALGMEPSSLKPNQVFTGVPVAAEFKRINATQQRNLKKTFGFNPEMPLVVITGGSQGSQHINEAVRKILPELLNFTSVGLVAGNKHYESMIDLKQYETWENAKLQSNFRMWAFNTAMNELMGAADIVISRAGATTINELAALGKAVVLVPFEDLPGGHQVKNAERLVELQAAAMVSDARMVKQPKLLLDVVEKLIENPELSKNIADNLHNTIKLDAASELAQIILSVGKE